MIILIITLSQSYFRITYFHDAYKNVHGFHIAVVLLGTWKSILIVVTEKKNKAQTLNDPPTSPRFLGPYSSPLIPWMPLL